MGIGSVRERGGVRQAYHYSVHDLYGISVLVTKLPFRTNRCSYWSFVWSLQILICKIYCTGNATTTKFAIYCSGFLDEGINPYPDIDRDRIDNNPLKYQYYVVDKYIEDDGSETISRTSFFSGGMYSQDVSDFIFFILIWLSLYSLLKLLQLPKIVLFQ